jgi:hypothetical protein
MAVIRLVRFDVEPEQADDMIARRAALVSATRSKYAGLDETRLSRIDERTWVDVWRWESLAHAEAAIRGVPEIPEAAVAFELASVRSAEFAEIVDER